MPRFHYKALEADGTARQGDLEAADSAAAAQVLHKRGLLVVQVQAGQGRGWRARSTARLKQAFVLNFTQQLAILLGAGQPLEQALAVLLRQQSGEGTAAHAVLERIRERVKGGKALSTAMAEEDGQFPALYLSVVRAGEASGALHDTLQQLSDYLERREVLKGQLVNALIYPVFLVVGVIAALILLIAYVVPQFVPIFKDLGVPLPLITEAILATGLFIANRWPWLLAALATLSLAWPAYWRAPERKRRLHRRLLAMPVVGELGQRLEVARLARTLGTLLRNGVPLLEALAIARQVCLNQAVAELVDLALARVRNGGSLAAALHDDQLLPSLALQMIEVGEQAGQLDRVLLKVADVFDQQAQRSIDRLLAALVPTLTLVMALLVAVIMLAIMLPLMSLTNTL
ncbi:MAG TPA: type II secretion system F family protein [Pseudomonas sp.]|uniref:type II secretion system F family protein n=1 Tax=Pseudomonas sp. TaxID=306 RepID=UPI002B459C7C|nr:type II secretion system F family protein [Pseudomonas sp.]HKS13368.1 type II secretion system F family protein [Pseudomonas sp.]